MISVISTTCAERPLHPSHYKSQLITTASRKSPARCPPNPGLPARHLTLSFLPAWNKTGVTAVTALSTLCCLVHFWLLQAWTNAVIGDGLVMATQTVVVGSLDMPSQSQPSNRPAEFRFAFRHSSVSPERLPLICTWEQQTMLSLWNELRQAFIETDEIPRFPSCGILGFKLR